MIWPVIIYVLFVLWLLYAWYRSPRIQTKQLGSDIKVSVIIPVRNDWLNLQLLLQGIQKQTYSNLECLVIDDCSADELKEQLPHYTDKLGLQVLLLEVENFEGIEARKNNNKKKAISIGVNHATGSLILCTDADVEVGPQWIESMVNYYQKHQTQFFCAPVLFKPQNSIWGKYLEVDQINNMAVAEATTNVQTPFLAAGANMAFSKQAWEQVNGFEGIEHVVSGDDMFLLQRIDKAFPGQIGFNTQPEAIVYTKPEDSLNAFIHQRVRWFSKSLSYERLHGFLILMGIWLFNLYVVTHLVLFPFLWPLSGIVLLLKIWMDILFLWAPLSRYQRNNYLVYLPLFSIWSAIYITCIACITPFWNYRWKSAS